MILKKTILLIVLMLLVSSLSSAQQAGQRTVDFSQFLRELVIVQQHDNQKQLAIWMPYDFFFQISLAEPDATVESVTRSMADIKGFQIFIIYCYDEDEENGPMVQSTKSLLARAVLQLADGNELQAMETVPEPQQTILEVMKNGLVANMGGRTNYYKILLFDERGLGNKLVNTATRDSIKLLLKKAERFDEASFIWRTPFEALSDPLPCPECTAKIFAKYLYCPWCGHEME